jgi:hypothetical protein
MHQHLGPAPRVAVNGSANRRALFGRAARLVGSGAVAVAISSPLISGASSRTASLEIAPTDLLILERLIALEGEVGAFFGGALSHFRDVGGAASDQTPASQSTLTRIWFHDRGHLDLLRKRLDAVGGRAGTLPIAETPPPPESFAAFLWTATEMKNASVTAYVDAVAALEHVALRRVMAGILAVEARHAAYLSARIGEPAFSSETEGLSSASTLLTDESRFAPSDGSLIP